MGTQLLIKPRSMKRKGKEYNTFDIVIPTEKGTGLVIGSEHDKDSAVGVAKHIRRFFQREAANYPIVMQTLTTQSVE